MQFRLSDKKSQNEKISEAVKVRVLTEETETIKEVSFNLNFYKYLSLRFPQFYLIPALGWKKLFEILFTRIFYKTKRTKSAHKN